MSDPSAAATDLDALAASLQADARDSGVFFRVLCERLHDALPASTDVERRRSVFKDRRLAQRIIVRIGDETFDAELVRGEVACRHTHSVSGVGGGLPWSRQVSVDEWLRGLLTALGQDAKTNAAAASALRSLVT